jgi:biofilm protein TabA
MIFENINTINLTNYNFDENIINAIEFIKLNLNKHFYKKKINMENFQVIFNSYKTAPLSEKSPEQHKRFIDIHCMISGNEKIGVSFDNHKNIILKKYDFEKDCILYKKLEFENFIILKPQYFCIFYPTDIHRPGCSINKSEEIKKIIIKIPI